MAANIKIFEFDECDFVAAESREQAIAWYCRQVGFQIEDFSDNQPAENPVWHTCEEVDVATSVTDEDDGKTTMGALAKAELDEGRSLPCFVGHWDP